MIKNCTIGTKLALGFGGILLLLVIFAAVAVGALRNVKGGIGQMKNERLPYAILAEEMAFDVIQVQQFLTDVGATREPDAYQEAEEAAASFRKGADRFREMFRLENNREGLATLSDLEREFTVFYDLGKQMADAYAKEGTEGGNRTMRDFDKASETLAEKVRLFKKGQVDKANVMAGQVEQSTGTVETILLVLGLAGLIIGVLVAWGITRSIRRPLNTTVDAIGRIAAGDLTVRVPEHGTSEIGMLAGAVNRMADDMNGVLVALVQASNHLASASAELVAQADQMACGAEEVSAQTQAVATASEEMAATAHDIAANCTLAADSSRTANERAATGANIIRQTVDGMQRIADKVRRSSDGVANLGVRSEQIGQIVSTIEDIADQTNLLALNAAIEAARAGEQGRGFAVVADEVRALAERTAKATHEITGMIRSIQQEIGNAVKAMEEGVTEVSSGTERACQSSDALEEIVRQIEAMTNQVNQIAVASEQQNATTVEITNNIQQVTMVIEASSRGRRKPLRRQKPSRAWRRNCRSLWVVSGWRPREPHPPSSLEHEGRHVHFS